MVKNKQIRPKHAPKSPRPGEKPVVLIGFDGLQALDLIGPIDAFAKANARAAEAGLRAPYRLILASPKGGEIIANAGVRLAGATPLAALPRVVDTIIIGGGSEAAMRRAAEESDLLKWLRRRARTTRRIGSVCTGAFILAAAGVLDGRRATTHWASCARLAKTRPQIEVDANAIFVIDGAVFSSAGVTAGIDLSLALIEADLGAGVARAVVRDLVLFFRRPGGQAQYSAGLLAQERAGARLEPALAWIAEHPDANLSVAALAHKLNMSERNFARVFAQDVAITPARYVELARLEKARLYLETTDWPLARIAERSGYGSVATLLRMFQKHLQITPGAYRDRFGARQVGGICA